MTAATRRAPGAGAQHKRTLWRVCSLVWTLGVAYYRGTCYTSSNLPSLVEPQLLEQWHMKWCARREAAKETGNATKTAQQQAENAGGDEVPHFAAQPRDQLPSRSGQQNRGKLYPFTTFNCDSLQFSGKSLQKTNVFTGLLPTARLRELLYIFRNFFVVLLQCTRWTFTGKMAQSLEGFVNFSFGAPKQGQPLGLMIAFADNEHTSDNFSKPVVIIPGRAGAVRYTDRREHVDLVALNVLAPGEDHTPEAKNLFYHKLLKFVIALPKRVFLLGGGDLNAHLAYPCIPPHFGPHGIHEELNDNGTRWRDFLISSQCVALNTLGRPLVRSWRSSTFHGGSDDQGTQIDFQFTRVNALKDVAKPARTDHKLPVREAGKKPDHRPVCSVLKVREVWPRKRKKNAITNIPWNRESLVLTLNAVNIAAIQTKEGKDREPVELHGKFLHTLNTFLPALDAALNNSNATLSELWALFDHIIASAGAEHFLRDITGPRKSWISEHTWAAIRDKISAVVRTQGLRHIHIAAKEDERVIERENWKERKEQGFSWQPYTALEKHFMRAGFEAWKCTRREKKCAKEARRLTRLDYAARLKQFAEDAAAAHGKGDQKKLHAIVKQVAPKPSLPNVALLTDEGLPCWDSDAELNEFGIRVREVFNAIEIEDEQPNYEHFVASSLAQATPSTDAGSDKIKRGWELEIYTDGSATTKPGGGRRSFGRACPRFSAGWCFVAYLRNLSTGQLTKVYEAWGPIRTAPAHPDYVGSEAPTNTAGELEGLLRALKWVQYFLSLPGLGHLLDAIRLRFDNLFAGNVASGKATTDLHPRLVALLQQCYAHPGHSVRIYFQHVRGHSGQHGNEAADKGANRGRDGALRVGQWSLTNWVQLLSRSADEAPTDSDVWLRTGRPEPLWELVGQSNRLINRFRHILGQTKPEDDYITDHALLAAAGSDEPRREGPGQLASSGAIDDNAASSPRGGNASSITTSGVSLDESRSLLLSEQTGKITQQPSSLAEVLRQAQREIEIELGLDAGDLTADGDDQEGGKSSTRCDESTEGGRGNAAAPATNGGATTTTPTRTRSLWILDPTGRWRRNFAGQGLPPDHHLAPDRQLAHVDGPPHALDPGRAPDRTSPSPSATPTAAGQQDANNISNRDPPRGGDNVLNSTTKADPPPPGAAT